MIDRKHKGLVVALLFNRLIFGSDPSYMVRMFTGSPTRMVWVQHNGDNRCCEGRELTLMGLDTEDGKGIRTIITTPSAYSCPMLTHDGTRIVYTEKGWNPWDDKIYTVKFNGTQRLFLKNGYASDVWQDPSTKREWVYYSPGGGEWNDNPPIKRFLVDVPSHEELIWDKGRVLHRHFDVSNDGKAAAGGFDGRYPGIAWLPNDSRQTFGSGCEMQISPDNQYIMWHFNSAPNVHRYLCLRDKKGNLIDRVNVYEDVPGNTGWEVFHPRWSNKIHYFVVDGPYTGGQRVCVNHDCGDYIADGGPQVEVFIGKFNTLLKGKVTQWVQVTQNQKADFYPDIMILPKTQSVTRIAAKKTRAATAMHQRLWGATAATFPPRHQSAVYDLQGRTLKIEKFWWDMGTSAKRPSTNQLKTACKWYIVVR